MRRRRDPHGWTSNLRDERRQRLSPLRRQSGEEGTYEGGSGPDFRWLTGYSQSELEAHLEARTNFETFFAGAPHPNPARAAIKEVICGIRVEDIQEPTMREIRHLDKLVDELAKGKAMEKILPN